MTTVREGVRVSFVLTAALVLSLLLAGCGGQGGLHVKVAGAGDREVPAKPGYTFAPSRLSGSPAS